MSILLETHYQPQIGSLGMQHQPKALSQKAATELIEFCLASISVAEATEESALERV